MKKLKKVLILYEKIDKVKPIVIDNFPKVSKGYAFKAKKW